MKKAPPTSKTYWIKNPAPHELNIKHRWGEVHWKLYEKYNRNCPWNTTEITNYWFLVLVFRENLSLLFWLTVILQQFHFYHGQKNSLSLESFAYGVLTRCEVIKLWMIIVFSSICILQITWFLFSLCNTVLSNSAHCANGLVQNPATHDSTVQQQVSPSLFWLAVILLRFVVGSCTSTRMWHRRLIMKTMITIVMTWKNIILFFPDWLLLHFGR